MFRQLLGYTTLLLSVVLSGCGGGDPVPPSSTVLISPSSIKWEISAKPTPCPVNSNVFIDHTIVISVLDTNNSPLGSVDIRVVTDLTGNTFSGLPVLNVYDDKNGNGVVDDPAELVSSNTSPAFMTATDRYTGTKTILLRVNLSCPYKGNLHVYAGAAYSNINIEVKTP